MSPALTAVEYPTSAEDGTGTDGPLGVVEAFVRTYDPESGHEVFTDPSVLGRWLSKHRLLRAGERITRAEDVERAIAFREALRDWMAANHDQVEPAEPARAVIDREAERLSFHVRVDADGSVRLEPAGSGLDRALGGILAVVTAAVADGTWRRMKVCVDDTCRAPFYDESRNRSGKWCSMAVCGNRAKVRAFRRRQG